MTVRLLTVLALLALPPLRAACDKPPADQPRSAIAVFVVGRDGKVAARFFTESYKKRTTTSDLLAALDRQH